MGHHLSRVTFHPETYPTGDYYPFTLPFFHQTEYIDFPAPVTLFVGENGAGKSTLLEALAHACDIHIWGKTEGARYQYNPYENHLFRLCKN